jgi:hypothetical protein
LADTSTAGSVGTVGTGGAAVVVGDGTEVVVDRGLMLDRALVEGCRGGEVA